ncbi:MAG: ROK family protein [Lachnospiraceae bacterium]|jgi:glucokinase|nr:ROK family protein [Lachnospiraceae bacterium]
MEKLKLAIDVGGTKIAYGLLNEKNEITYRYQTLTPLEIMPEEFTQKLCTEIDTVLKQAGCAQEQLAGIAVGMPSYVDYENGIVVTSGSIRHIKNYPARDILKKRFSGIPILIDNDTNMAALAEHRCGAGKGFHHMVYVALSTGLGTGFIVNDQLFRGSYGGAGESGHMLITPGKGITDGCGNPGCFMSYACGSCLVRHALLAIENGASTRMTEMVTDLSELNAKHIAEAYRQGDALGKKLIEQLIYYASLHIYNLFIAFNINCYVCGGGLTNMGDFLLERIQEQADLLNTQENQKIYIKKAALPGDNGLIGCKIALDTAFQ